MHALAIGLLMLGALGPEAAPRAPAERVALIRIEGDERLQTRLAAELRAQRYEVIEVEGTPEAALAATGAHAAIRVESSPAAIRVWISNGVTGKQIFREVAPEEHERLDRAIVALWTVELLRASAIAPRVPEPAPRPAPPPRAGIALAVAPAAAWSQGGLGTSWHLTVGARWRRWSRGGAEALLLVPVLPTRLERTNGVALVSMGLLGVGLFAATGEPGARWSAQAALGAALLVTRATGDTTALYEGSTDYAVSAGPYARAGASLRLSAWFRARVDALSGVMLPRPVVQFDGANVASWGRPWLAALVGAEATF